MGNDAFMLTIETNIKMGIEGKKRNNESKSILCFADQGRERIQGQGGLRTASMFAKREIKIDTLRLPPRRIEITVSVGLGSLFARNI